MGTEAVAFVNATALTMDPVRPRADTVVVRGGRIAAVGERGLADAHPDASQVDLGGRLLVPGFIDAHHHLCLAALHPRWADLRGAADLDDVAGRLRAAADREPHAEWIRAAGWDQFDTGLALTAADLDAVGLDRPVLVGCFSYYRAVVSSAGLDALGISAATPDPPGGRIDRDHRGRPTGLLVETAWTAAHQASLAGYAEPDRWADLLEGYATGLLAEGITAVHDAAVTAEDEAVYHGLRSSGRLPLSVLVMPHGPILAGPEPGRFDGPPTGEGDEWLRVGPVKLFADGGVEPAIDAQLGGAHVHTGELMPELETAMLTAVERGFGVAVHAMGNAGLRATLDAWRAATSGREPAAPMRVEHVTLAGTAEVLAMRDLGVAGVVQPGFVDLIGRTIGDLRFDDATFLPFADLLAAGVELAASSDAPCHLTAPMLASGAGATRLTAGGRTVGVGQAVPLGEWLRLYTAGAADVGGQGGERGRLRPGLRADLVVLDGWLDDPARPPSVAETWVAGRRVWPAAS